MVKNLIDSYGNKPFIAILSYDEPENNIICAPEDAEKFGIKFKINAKNYNKINYTLEKEPIEFEKYLERFNILSKYQKSKQNELLNLCFPTKIKTNLSLEEIYQYSTAKALVYKENDFVCFSPEPFITIKNGCIHTFPMKGTIDATLPNAKEILLNNKKEIDEQYKMVGFMKDDLSLVAEDIKVEKFRYIQRVKNLYQTSSYLKGKIKANLSLGDIFSALVPAASIAGSPRDKAIEIIKECEISKRGFYTGAFVYFDGNICKSFVLIRFVKQSKDGLYFFSGGGVTQQSDPKKEYDELIKKVYFPF
ncbi:aminodeoxychorismate synthase component I [Campylobacter pinnipediorum]|uniref:aminodeoxychorismate synthase component I n=1 Tax=Campylobacter pinnipediorum TaxID=1965231 RepID=UPI00084D1AE7|nr:aminodeoxychorismate synthase component I [Campylobacter pinnipediorum]AQW82338.1 aminodeoxychorismate synthase, component I [Campylobacter pinnipediorum subsp. pinnipediorum]